MVILFLVLVTVAAYLAGGIPVGALIANYHKIDISQHGSGKIGTTNVLRTVGKRAAALVLLGDFLKGVAAVLTARILADTLFDGRVEWLGYSVSVVTLAGSLAALAVVAGHVWSIYLRLAQGKWSGGRGAATALGAALAINPLIVLGAVLIGAPAVLISRYVSLGSILGAIGAGITVIVLVIIGQMDVLSLLFIAISIFIVATHRDNIERLLKGTERKLGDRVNV